MTISVNIREAENIVGQTVAVRADVKIEIPANGSWDAEMLQQLSKKTEDVLNDGLQKCLIQGRW